jgi:hypothetical protein
MLIGSATTTQNGKVELPVQAPKAPSHAKPEAPPQNSDHIVRQRSKRGRYPRLPMNAAPLVPNAYLESRRSLSYAV